MPFLQKKQSLLSSDRKTIKSFAMEGRSEEIPLEVRKEKKRNKKSTERSVDPISLSQSIQLPLINSESKKIKCLQGEILSCVALSSTKIFVGSIDLSIRLWDVVTGQWIWSMKGHSKGICVLAIDHQKPQRLFSGGLDGAILVWDANVPADVKFGQDKAPLKVLKDHKKDMKITSLAYSPTSDTLYSASEDKTLRVWNLKEGKSEILGGAMSEEQLEESPTDLKGKSTIREKYLVDVTVTALCVVDSLAKLFVATGKRIQVYDTKTRSHIQTLAKGHRREITSLVYANDYLFSGSKDWTIAAWKVSTGELLRVLDAHTSSVESLVVYGNRLFSGSENSTIRMWDISSAEKFEPLQGLKGHKGKVSCLTAIDGFIFSGSADKVLRIWDTKLVSDNTEYKHEKEVICVTGANGVLYTSSGKRTITAWDTEKGTKREFKGHEQVISCLEIHDNILYSGSHDKTIYIWNVLTAQPILILRGHAGAILSIVIKDELLYSGSADGTLRCWDTATGECLRIWSRKEFKFESPDQSSGTETKETAENLNQSTLIASQLVKSTSNNALDAETPDSPRKISEKKRKDEDKKRKEEEERAKKMAKEKQEKEKGIQCIAAGDTAEILMDAKNFYNVNISNYVFSSNWGSKDIIKWSTQKSGQMKGTTGVSNDDSFIEATLRGHEAAIVSLIIYSDENKKLWLFSGSEDGTVRVWDAKSGECAHVVSNYNEPIQFMKIIEGELYTASKLGIRVWELRDLQEYKPACNKYLIAKDPLVDISIMDNFLLVASVKSNTVIKYNLQIYETPAIFRNAYSLQKLEALLDPKSKFENAESDPRESIESARTLLKFYCGFGLVEPAKFLLRNLKRIGLTLTNQRDINDESGLYATVQNQRWSLLKQVRNDAELASQVQVDSQSKRLLNFLKHKFRMDDLNFYRGYVGKSVDYPEVEVLSSCFLNKNSKLRILQYWISTTLDFNTRDHLRRTPLHYACYYGNLSATKLLAQDDRIIVNALDHEGNSCLHFTLRENSNPLCGERGNRSHHQLIADRFDCVQYLVTTKSESKKPKLTLQNKNWEKLTPYELLLYRYQEDSKSLQVERKELQDKKEILSVRKQFEQTCEILDFCNEQVEEVKDFRTKWATQHFMYNMLPYATWLIMLLIIAFGSSTKADGDVFWFNEGLKQKFVEDTDFESVATIDGFWNWFDNGLFPALNEQEWHNEFEPEDPSKRELFLSGQKIVGAAQMRQLRNSNTSCTIPEEFNGMVYTCYSPRFKEDKLTYGPTEEFVWKAGDEDSKFWGKFGDRYPGSGYFAYVSPSFDSQPLKDNFWVDSSTRLIVISFTVYSVNLNYFGIVKLAVEFPPTGRIVPYSSVQTIKALRYDTSYDDFILAIEILALIYFFITFPIRELIEIYTERLQYFKEPWNYYEWAIIGFVLAILGLRVGSVDYVNSLDLRAPTDTYVNFEPVSDTYLYEQYFSAVVIIMCFLRALKFIKIMPIVGPTTQAILSTLKHLSFVVFVGVFVFALISFSFAFHIAFGLDIFDIRNVLISVMTMFRMALGDGDYQSLEDSNRVFGPILFILFMFFVGILLMNMFIAVLSEVYIKVQEQNAQEWEIFISNIMAENFYRTWIIRNYLLTFKKRFNYGRSNEENLVDLYDLEVAPVDTKSVRPPRPQSAQRVVPTADETYEEKTFVMNEQEIFELTLEMKIDRMEKTPYQIYKLVQANQNKLQSEISALHTEMQQLKKLLSTLAEKK